MYLPRNNMDMERQFATTVRHREEDINTPRGLGNFDDFLSRRKRWHKSEDIMTTFGELKA